MTPTERAKRSDALYYETVSVNRRVLCDMIANRESDLEDAKADNAKLRELCAGLLTGYECGYGELCDGCSWNGLEGDCAARTKARDLGVEVD